LRAAARARALLYVRPLARFATQMEAEACNYISTMTGEAVAAGTLMERCRAPLAQTRVLRVPFWLTYPPVNPPALPEVEYSEYGWHGCEVRTGGLRRRHAGGLRRRHAAARQTSRPALVMSVEHTWGLSTLDERLEYP
jgi:hypothetical protein